MPRALASSRLLRIEPLEDRRLLALVTVDTLTDTVDFNDGATSLREAIFATNLVGGADTIDFAPALTSGAPATITLTQGELAITDDLTITGPGANLLTIDASGNDPTPDSTFDDGDSTNDGDGTRIFNVDDGNFAEFTVSITGLALVGGDVTGHGGAILSSENLSLTSCLITANQSRNLGGGVGSTFGNLVVTNCTIRDNAAVSGGGGMFCSVVNLTVIGSTFTGNTARNGGGIDAFTIDTYPMTIDLIDCSITGNSATVSDGGGMSVTASNGTFTVDGTVISGNSAGRFGGGLEVTAYGAPFPVTVASSTISGNSAAVGGGGIDIRGDNLHIIGSTISGNSAGSYGGGINNRDHSLRISDSMISSNVANRRGGGIYNVGQDTVISGSTLNDNSAMYGGGMFNFGDNVLITGSTLSGNSASRDGGGVFNEGIGLEVFHSTVTENSASAGAGIYNIGHPFSTVPESTTEGASSSMEVGQAHHLGWPFLNHTIVSGNVSGTTGTPNDVYGVVVMEFSLLGVDSGATVLQHGANFLGTAAAPIDAMLGPLADNGGPTKTHALLLGSPAIDTGDSNFDLADPDGDPMTDDAILYDQRGAPFGRVFDGDAMNNARIDIGAFELQPTPPALPGDYNRDNSVDAGDYVWWRKSLGATGVPAYTGADGDGDTTVDEDDYGVWRMHFGETLPAGAGGDVEYLTMESSASSAPVMPVSERLAHVAASFQDADGRQSAPQSSRVALIVPPQVPSELVFSRRGAPAQTLSQNERGTAAWRNRALMAWLDLRGDHEEIKAADSGAASGDEDGDDATDRPFEAIDVALDGLFWLAASGIARPT